MALYRYQVKDWQGRKKEGTYSAANLRDVAEYLRGQKLIILNIKESGQAAPKPGKSFMEISLFQKKPSSRDLMIFCRQFATMIKAGITVLQGLEVIAGQTANRALAEKITQTARSLETGSSLSEALSGQSAFFPSIMVSMVEAGESGGVLDDVLERLATHFERQHDLQQKIKSATTYPLVVSCVAVLVVFFMITFTLPAFARIFDGFGIEMPVITRVLLAVGQGIIGFWYLILAGFALTFFVLQQYLRTEAGRFRFDSFRLKIPLFGSIYHMALMARFSRTFSTLVTSGVDILTSMELVAQVIDNSRIAQAVKRARDNVRQGQAISDLLRAEGLFPPMLVAMIASGEETGALDEMLAKTADFYESEVSYAVERLSSLIEPLLIIVVGSFVALIVISMVMPIFQIYEMF